MTDTYDLITGKIIEKMQDGNIPWQKPWSSIGYNFTLPNNAITGNQYRGVNIPWLWLSADEKGYDTNEWASLKQWNEQSESIYKGEKGTIVVYYGTFEKEVDEQDKKIIPFLKSSYVFNRCQLKGYEPKPQPEKKNLVEVIPSVKEFVRNTHAIVKHDGNGRAFYSRADDTIHMPLPELFIDTKNQTASEGYYATVLHEGSHWTGPEKRLNRQFGKRFGDKAYAFEELIAEQGSAFLCCDLGITDGPKDNHAAYIQNWIQILKEDKRAIFTAASEASKACDFLHALQNKQELTGKVVAMQGYGLRPV